MRFLCLFDQAPFPCHFAQAKRFEKSVPRWKPAPLPLGLNGKWQALREIHPASAAESACLTICRDFLSQRSCDY